MVSNRFTDGDTWFFGGDRLCAACAWCYITHELRREVYTITDTPPSRVVQTRHQLGAQLVGPLTSECAVVIPVRGRRHILPTAQWQHVSTDDTQIRWGEHEAHLLAILRRLRTLPAVRARALNDPVPPIEVVRAHQPATWTQILADWSALEEWRRIPGSWWDAMIALSTPPTETSTK
ncbi:hypothetical protein GOEFS_119_00030 [Gordonia effusa NBRC 100432]|uniref:Uncharacterized protein n=1 Tax=Gordonia effusa NBRC 100432 TaxID=1077974 RepID=H0R612_9ACTN|nr:hypothetical protein [Gordonia effusa]GAB20513.1 hypothetical protein GOEFS_119_00030 [Gordonia effusa NBRC 100432]